MSHDPQMVKRVAQAICDADIGMLSAYETLAKAALEASHHAKLVGVLRWIQANYHSPNINHEGFRVEAAVKADRVLAKIGGDV